VDVATIDAWATDAALATLRVAFGIMIAAHGWNKVSTPARRAGVPEWFASIGMRAPRLQARVAAATEIGVGLALVLGLATPLAAAGLVGLMVVAGIAGHGRNGFFVFRPGQGWEYTAMVGVAGVAIGALGAGRWSLDRALGLGWGAAVDGGIALALGVGAGLLHLAVSWRPGRVIVRAGLGLVVAVIAAMWIYALFFASKESVNRIGDGDWTSRAEATCATAKADRAALADLRRIDDAGPDALARRADLVDAATDGLARAIAEVGERMPRDAKGAAIVPLWLADYDVYIADRRAYADALRRGDNSPFSETTTEGLPVSEKLATFAADNDMPSCRPPMDLSV